MKSKTEMEKVNLPPSGSPELAAALGTLLAEPAGEQRVLALDTEAFVKLDTTKEPKPIVKMFGIAIGGEVIMPTGEILKISTFFPREVPPVRVGVYVTRHWERWVEEGNSEAAELLHGFAHYDGKDWGPQFQTPESASDNHGAAKWPAMEWAALIEEHPDNQI